MVDDGDAVPPPGSTRMPEPEADPGYLNRRTLRGALWWARWVVAGVGTLLLLLYSPSEAAAAPPYPMSIAVALLQILIAINLVEWLAGRYLYRWSPVGWPLAQVAVDCGLGVLLTAFMAFDPGVPVWVGCVFGVVHAALRFHLPGAIAAWCGVSASYAGIQYFSAAQYGFAATNLQVVFYSGLLLVVGTSVGSVSAGLRLRDLQVDGLKAVASVTQRMTSMDTSSLVDEVVSAATKVGFGNIQVFTFSGDPPYWALTQGTRLGAAVVDEDPADVHLWCSDMARKIGDRTRPMYVWPEDVLASYRHLDWGKTQVLLAPVRSGRDLFAFIIATHPDPVPGYRKKTLMLLAAHAGAALANARRFAERGRYERRLAHQATHDALTGLPNRVLLHQRMHAALRRTKDTSLKTAVLLLDLDKFKEINDTLGHDYGDQLLMQVSERLGAMMRTGDVAARLGGDEFAVLVTGLSSVGEAVSMAKRVLDGVHQPFLVNGVTLDVEVSIGVAVSPEHGQTGEDLMRCADVAMYAAKREALGVQIYRASDDIHTPKRLALLGDMRRALETRDQFLLYYQPAVDTATGGLVGAEALLRWDHPDHSIVAPAEFIPGAEGTGLIHALSRYVMDVALDQAQGWAEMGLPIPIAINLSTRALMDRTLPDQVAHALAVRGLSPRTVRLEITESSIMSDPERALAVLRRLESLGVPMSIDDFGTGYSSMTYLKHLPVDEIKIDKSFVSAMVAQNKDAMLVRSLVELGHNLGLRVVAEGVEDSVTLQALRDLGCDIVQGFYIAKPMAADHFVHWLTGGAPADRAAG